MNTKAAYSLAHLLRIFIPFALGYFLSYLYRVVNNVIASDLSASIAIDAGQLGMLTSAYLITFAAFQLPLGILLDRYGPRRIEALLLLFAAGGAAIFASADSLTALVIGRGLIGFGVSACLMAAFKAFVQWFPSDKLPMINGLQFAAGGLGILAASMPVEFALQLTDWRGVFWALAALTLIIAALIFWVVPDKPIVATEQGLQDHIAGIIHIFTHPKFWQIAPWAVSTQMTFIAVMSLWTGPWLRDVAGLERADAAQVLAWVAVGTILGYLALGFMAERLARIGFSTLHVASAGMMIFMLVQLAIINELIAWSSTLWFAFGFFGTTGVLAYAHLSQQFPAHLAGRVNTALNLLVFVFAFLAQWGIGEIIKASSESTQHYSTIGYQQAFIAVLLIQCITMLLYFWRIKYHSSRINHL